MPVICSPRKSSTYKPQDCMYNEAVSIKLQWDEHVTVKIFNPDQLTKGKSLFFHSLVSDTLVFYPPLMGRATKFLGLIILHDMTDFAVVAGMLYLF